MLATIDQSRLTNNFEYDNLGRLSAVVKPQVFDPEGGTNARPRYEYQYDQFGNILLIRDPKRRDTKFTYDALGQLLSHTLPLQQTEYQSNNVIGQVDSKVDFKGQTNRFVYDSFGRMVTNFLYAVGASTPSQTNRFEYQSDGRLYRITRPEGTTTFAYNLDGAITNLVSAEGAINYAYDSVTG